MSKESELKRIIKEKVFINGSEYSAHVSGNENRWIFDFRKILMDGRSSDLISEIFYEQFSLEYPFQVGTLEIAGVPLVTSILNKLYAKGHADCSAFFIRKSRKKSGLLKMIEGVVVNNRKIILVDDIINSGDSFWRQIEVLEGLGHKVDTVWSIVQYRDASFYARFHARNIKVRSLFTLDDLTDELGGSVHNVQHKQRSEPSMPFKAQWVFKAENPSLEYVVSKSQPVIDGKNIYFGTDNRSFYALNHSDGTVAWKFRVGLVSKKKGIFSNPLVFNNSVIFGAYDGNVYCLDKTTGKQEWISYEADWVGSSPALAPDLGFIFIGLEYGLVFKHGGIAALDARTGRPIWIDRTHKGFTHCSPLYIQEHTQVAIGSNDGIVRLYDAKNGKALWTFTTFGASDLESQRSSAESGFGNGDIKESFVYSKKHDYVIFGAIDGVLYILNRSTGHLVFYHKCEFGIYSSPYLYQDKVYFTSTDKRLRCIDLTTLEMLFIRNIDDTRIFSTPTVINGRLYIGTNAGRLHELDPITGEELGYFQATERVTNTVVYDQGTDTYFLPTFANEIISLKRDAG